MKLYLDDVRPLPAGDDWLIARGLLDFQIQIQANGAALEVISFDHDLGEVNGREMPSGLDCAHWLTEWLMDGNTLPKLKEIFVHSSNPPGRDNIVGYFKSAQKAGILVEDIILG